MSDSRRKKFSFSLSSQEISQINDPIHALTKRWVKEVSKKIDDWLRSQLYIHLPAEHHHLLVEPMGHTDKLKEILEAEGFSLDRKMVSGEYRLRKNGDVIAVLKYNNGGKLN